MGKLPKPVFIFPKKLAFMHEKCGRFVFLLRPRKQSIRFWEPYDPCHMTLLFYSDSENLCKIFQNLKHFFDLLHRIIHMLLGVGGGVGSSEQALARRSRGRNDGVHVDAALKE